MKKEYYGLHIISFLDFSVHTPEIDGTYLQIKMQMPKILKWSNKETLYLQVMHENGGFFYLHVSGP